MKKKTELPCYVADWFYDHFGMVNYTTLSGSQQTIKVKTINVTRCAEEDTAWCQRRHDITCLKGMHLNFENKII